MKSGSKPHDPVYGVCKKYTSVSNRYVPSTFKLDCIFFPRFLICVYIRTMWNTKEVPNTYAYAILFSFEVTLTSIISKSLKFWHYCNAWSILSTYKYVDVCMMEILDLFLNFECIFICSLTVKTENKLQLRLEDYITNLLSMFIINLCTSIT